MKWLDQTKAQTFNNHLVDLDNKLRSGNVTNQDIERVEGQGVFWGGARGIFPGGSAKTEDIQNDIEKMWRARGNEPIRQTQEDVYNHMFKLANERAERLERPHERWEPGGIALPEWFGVHQRPGLSWDFFRPEHLRRKRR